MFKPIHIILPVVAAALLAVAAGPAAEAGRFNAATEEGRPVSSYKGKRVVDYDTSHPAGTIIVDTRRRKLFFVLEGGQAIRYGVGVGRQGFSWAGSAYIAHKAEWPAWRPPAAMRKRQPELPVYMEGGPNNPLGARALYLFQGGRDNALPDPRHVRAAHHRPGGVERLYPHAERRGYRPLRPGAGRRPGGRDLMSAIRCGGAAVRSAVPGLAVRRRSPAWKRPAVPPGNRGWSAPMWSARGRLAGIPVRVLSGSPPGLPSPRYGR